MKINNNLYSLDAVDLAKKLLGKILVRNINGIEIEAKSTGSYIDPRTEVVVLKVEKARIIVKPKNS